MTPCAEGVGKEGIDTPGLTLLVGSCYPRDTPFGNDIFHSCHAGSEPVTLVRDPLYVGFVFKL